MMMSIVSFKLQRRWTLDEAASVFESTAPKYLGKPGLIRKHYFLTEDGARAGGVYLWKTKADAEACYTREWQANVTEKYGRPPEIHDAHVPVSVDNDRRTIET
jgi:hypothetical protein